MNRVLITGSTGFVGQNLCPYLENKSMVLDKISRDDLYNITHERLNERDIVIHLAGKAHDLNKTSDGNQYNQVNFELSKSLYDKFLLSDAKVFIFISSVKATADSTDAILNEDNFSNPITDYGKSKLLAEQYIQSQPLPVGKLYIILRPCMIHGPGNKGNLNLLYQVVKKNIPYPLSAFNNSRSFLSIENLCFVIYNLIILKDLESGVYNVADDEPLSTIEVVGLLSKSLGKNARLWFIPKPVINSLAKLGDWLKLPLDTERLNKLTESYVVSNEKIKRCIKKPLPLSSREGLILTANSFRSI